MKTVGVIGGSGLYEMEGLEQVDEIFLETPYGNPSDVIISGHLGGTRLLFVPRHGRGHNYLPHEVPYRANIWALKELGADWCISLSAVGSLREEIVPGHVVLIDQFIDRTKGRPSSFFGDGVAGHVAFGEPISPVLQEVLVGAARDAGATLHVGGTYVCMEGPAFSTRAESELYRSWGASVIGMTNLPEAKLAREAEIAYATVALATDYDCWHPGHDDVSVDAVIATLKKNVTLAKKIVALAASRIPDDLDPLVDGASRFAVMTAPDRIPAHRREALRPIIGKYLAS
ncbi:MAG TPA: S-methyl-5'-thioadenosine phosphorylase [Deltaproteobacteria bacterium]|nr:S-methyl-5'-thioadenosine phosphorylase [Deltaproteobacteria bacterium]HCP47843.1 S-methyl-5'-thioadenosine phosphorylase [Deltaproteobacteria bacterium]|tara:strand:- start:233 stop:1093 length:861 start_codon:yes stop_codon:yes gene_type:complete